MDVTTIAIGDLRLALASAGSGGRPILLLHGFCGAKEDFTEWLPRLAGEGWHAVAYDQRGHGRSGHPAGEPSFSLQLFADDLRAVVDELGWDRFVLLGHSMGGMVGQLFALASPQRLTGLVLMDTSHGPPGLDASLVDLGRQIVRDGGMARLVEAQRAMGPGPLDSAAHLRVCEQRPGYQEFCDHKTLVASPDMWLAMIQEMFSQPDRLVALADLAVPVLVVVGAEDEGFGRDCRDMAAAIPGARLAEIAGGGHSPQFEAPERWWQALSTFLSEVPA